MTIPRKRSAVAIPAIAVLALVAMAAGLYRTASPAGPAYLTVRPAAGSDAALGTPASVAGGPAATLRRQPWTAASADPFRPVSFAPPPLAPAVVQAPPPALAEKPVAPPFPYQFFGRMVAVDGKTLTYLIRDGNLVPVQQGEVIDGTYRVDAASATQLQVTYLPLNEQSTLALQTAAQ